MSEMIERVAQNIYAEALSLGMAKHTEWADMDKESSVKQGYRWLARAAIAAMYEPTEKMLRAGVNADYQRTGFQTVKHIHQVMIDSALSSPQYTVTQEAPELAKNYGRDK